jgi:uncharacterized LabA/DUF88 family protein
MREDKYAILVDGSNLYATARLIDKQIDYRVMLKMFPGRLFRALYFTALLPRDVQSGLRKTVDFMEYNGWSVIQKEARVFEGDQGERKIKGNMDMEIAIHALRLAPFVETIYLFTGDGDFRVLVEELQRLGVRVVGISSLMTSPPMIADVLRRQLDEFIELRTLNFIEQPARVNRWNIRG